MRLFNRKPKPDTPPQHLVMQPPAQSRVEVEVHKNATEQAAQKAQETNRHLNELLVENGFTLKIYLAAGGQLHQKRRAGDK